MKAQAPEGMIAIRMVKSPAPALQSDICTSTEAGQPGEMMFLLKLIWQMFSSFVPHPLEARVGVAVGAFVLVFVGVAVGDPFVGVLVGVLVGPPEQEDTDQETGKIPSLT